MEKTTLVKTEVQEILKFIKRILKSRKLKADGKLTLRCHFKHLDFEEVKKVSDYFVVTEKPTVLGFFMWLSTK